jgi:hypothetical protein
MERFLKTITNINMTQEEYLSERLEGQINWYNDNSTFNKHYYQVLKVSEIILAATTPFLIALMKDDFILKIAAGIMSIIIGIIAGVLIAFKFHEKWIQYRTTCENLKHEKYLFATKAGIYAQEQNFNIFVERVEFIISKENSDWTQIVISSDNKQNRQKHENS